MKKIFFLGLISFFFLSVQSQLLWKITGNKLKSPSYIFGTHHFLPISYLDSIPNLFKMYNQCDMVVGELIINNIDAREYMAKYASMPHKMTINNLLSKEEYNDVDKALVDVVKIGLKELSTMYPSLILTLYETELYKKLRGVSDNTAADSYFQLVALQQGKKVEGLENLKQQLNILLGSNTPKRQADILVQTVRHKDKEILGMLKLDQLYKAQKLDELLDMAMTDDNFSKMSPEEFQIMVDDRNKAWAEKLPKMMEAASCFICVGAMHLPGHKGLIKLLEKEGYSVKPVK